VAFKAVVGLLLAESVLVSKQVAAAAVQNAALGSATTVRRRNVDDERRELRAARLSGRLTASRACTLLVYFRLNMAATGT